MAQVPTEPPPYGVIYANGKITCSAPFTVSYKICVQAWYSFYQVTNFIDMQEDGSPYHPCVSRTVTFTGTVYLTTPPARGGCNNAFWDYRTRLTVSYPGFYGSTTYYSAKFGGKCRLNGGPKTP